MTTTKTAYQHGFDDGAEAARNSGVSTTPCDGWDSDLINAIGLRGCRKVFGLGEDEPQDSDSFKSALAEYCRGCEAGAKAELNEAE
jgi:hypothetical protein